MNNDKRSTMQYSQVTAPVRPILGLPHRADRSRQAKAGLSVWEGEGGAIEAPAAVLPLRPVPAEHAAANGTDADDIIDTIAYIEMQRQVMAKEEGVDIVCNEALRKLHDALVAEQELARSGGAGPMHAANVDALAIEVQRVKTLPRSHANTAHARTPNVLRIPTARQGAPRSPTNRPRVPRTMGRHGSSR